MNPSISHQLRLAVRRQGIVGRRDFLRVASAAGLAAGTCPWTDLVALRADDLRRRGMACILLWMQGGPSQFETLDPKPGHENGGETKAIATSVPGIELSENLPHLAKMMEHVALIRSLTTKEGNHQRASFLLHTSHVPTASIRYPTLGSVVASELAAGGGELPAFVRIGRRFPNAGDGGLLGSVQDPFAVIDPTRLPDNAAVAVDARYTRRLGFLDRLEAGDRRPGLQPAIADHRALYQKAARMVRSPQMEAFDIQREPQNIRDAYGESDFGAGCLLARRLIEAGVTFVEVSLGNWDTHDDNFNRSRELSGQLDQPYAFLLQDLAARGMLDQTLVIWMGEFGRTPRINPRTGRDHYPRAFSVALAGGGVRGGRVIGCTDAAGASVEDRPVTTEDLFCSFYQSLGINPLKENMSPIGRPIKIVDGGQPIGELFS